MFDQCINVIFDCGTINGTIVTITFPRPKTGELNLRGRNNNNWGK